jgi:hypothetical protein
MLSSRGSVQIRPRSDPSHVPLTAAIRCCTHIASETRFNVSYQTFIPYPCSLQSSPDWLKVPAWHLQAADPENFVHCRWVAVASYNLGYGSTPVFFDTDCAIPASLQLAGRQQQQQASTLSSMDSSGLSALSALSALSGLSGLSALSSRTALLALSALSALSALTVAEERPHAELHNALTGAAAATEVSLWLGGQLLPRRQPLPPMLSPAWLSADQRRFSTAWQLVSTQGA